jgi:adenosylcobinamide-GDP ribazoletransferase
MASAKPAGAGLAQAAGKASFPAAFIAGTLALGIGAGLAGPALLWGGIAAAIAAAWLLHTARKRLGGYTGDVLGAIQQMSLLALLAAACTTP